MKKKLVAFAVTAAMIITSAVPVFAVDWTDKPTTPTTNPNPNVITLDADENRATYAVAGPAADGAHFSQVIDLNKGPGEGHYYQYDLFFTDKENGTQKDQISTVVRGWSTGSNITVNGEQIVSNTKGMIELVYDVTEYGVDVSVIELGLQTPKVTTKKLGLAEGADWISHFNAGGDAAMTMYYEHPENVESLKVIVKNEEYDPIEAARQGASYAVPEYVEATQAVLEQELTISEVTLTADTKLTTADDIKTYTDIAWLRDGVTVVGTDVKYTPGDDDKGHKITAVVSGKAGTGVFDEVVWGADSEALARFTRYAGANRYETAMNLATERYLTNGKLPGVIIASGTDYPDALSAVALASEKLYPILLVNESYEDAVVDYINANATYSMPIYIVGGTGVVSQEFEDALYKYPNVERLAGADRYATNLAVLGELNIDTRAEILVASGTAYADVLSAAATGKPVVLVGDSLNSAQRKFLGALGHNDKYYIIGGTGVVSAALENELTSKEYVANVLTDVIRVAGDNRYTTNEKVYQQFAREWENTNPAVYIATGDDFADGLVAAANAGIFPFPLALVNNNNPETANYIIAEEKVADEGRVFVFGGTGAVSNELVQEIVVG